MKKYLFVFGRTPELSFLEQKSFFPQAELITTQVALASTESAIETDKLLASLGGTVKIAELIRETAELTPELLVSLITNKTGKKINFGVSLYDTIYPGLLKLLQETKKILAAKGIQARFLNHDQEAVLSSVVVQKNEAQEIVITKNNDKFHLGRTLAVQDFAQWSKRDYDRPGIDPKAGMLPPKIARIIVNLVGKPDSRVTILDPFCGVGTILTEALLSGFSVIGNDYSQVVLEKAKQNLHWLNENYSETAQLKAELFLTDATHISEKILPRQVEAIVTEPFMGKSANQEIKVKNIIKGLEKLYLGCLKDWHKVLKAKGKVIMALPEYQLGKQKFFVKKVIDSCENLGYTVVCGPYEYSRPQAIVKREFYIFQKK